MAHDGPEGTETMKRAPRKLQLRGEILRRLGTRDLREAKGGIKTIFDSYFLNCETGTGGEHTDNLCETAAGPCHTDWASCQSNYFGCGTTSAEC
jgi:hypothetical protein